MKKSTIKNLMIGAGITFLVSYVTFKIVRKQQEKRLLKELEKEEYEEYEEEPRHYIKIKEYQTNENK